MCFYNKMFNVRDVYRDKTKILTELYINQKQHGAAGKKRKKLFQSLNLK